MRKRNSSSSSSSPEPRRTSCHLRAFTLPRSAQKLGILTAASQPASKPREVALIGAPEGSVQLLGDVPDTVSFTSRLSRKTHLALCFIRSSEDLAATLDLLTLRLPERASAWIVYPKRTRHKHRDFDENDVRDTGLAAGLVDYKICSIDADWSAVKFARRKAKTS